MPNRSERKTRTGSRPTADRRPDLSRLGAGATDVIRQAAAVLETELAFGLAAVQRAEKRFREERKLDPADFEETVSRFRTTGHELVDMTRTRFEELKSRETDELVQRFLKDAHGVLDTVLNLVNLAPELVNRLLQPAEPRRPSGTRKAAARPRARAKATASRPA